MPTLTPDLLYLLLPAGILLLPLLAFAIILFFGQPLGKQADKVAIGALAVAFIMSVVLFWVNAREHGAAAQAHPVVTTFPWMQLGGITLTMGFLVDNLSAFMCIVVTGLATLVLVYSLFYMDGDTMYQRYFAYMSFFCFAMLGVVLSNSLLMTFVFWELVGLGSYFLIGFWFYKPPVGQDHHYQELKASYATGIDERFLSPAHAQKKAFVMNRVGDFGFLIGIALFLTAMLAASAAPGFAGLNLPADPLSYTNLYAAVDSGAFHHLTVFGMTGTALLTLAGILTFMGAIGKSAQFPLHTWLPDAMQGPTTGSSIIHAATMVAAGVYLTARLHPLLTDGALFFVAMIGAITALLAATMALVQWDIKAVLAYSTISQLGYMMVGLGAGSYSAGVAHLFTHAVFKCMLFLCAGSVIVACHHMQDMNRMGGLRRKMPLTYLATLAGTFAITGVPFFSGFYSKDAILAGSLARALELQGLHWIPFVLAMLAAGLTAFYMFRLLFMTFHGQPRDHHVYDHAHESPALATVPLLILAVGCLGFWWSGHLIGGNIMAVPWLSGEHGGWLATLIASPVQAPFSEEQIHLEHVAHYWASGLSVAALLAGSAVAYLMYLRRAFSADDLLKFAPLRLLYTILSQLWFFDRLYQDGIVPAAKRLNAWAWKFDARVVDGFLVDGWAVVIRMWALVARNVDNWFVDKCVDSFGWAAWLLGAVTRCLQTGRVQFYVGVSFAVAAVLWLSLLLVFP